MKKFYFTSFLFWFALLFVALFNATVRELTYKPLLTPIIGMWAHQISSITAVILFFISIRLYLKRINLPYSRKELLIVGVMWVFMTVLFECFMNFYIRHLSTEQVLQTYYFWNGDTWIFVLLSLVILPQVIYKLNRYT